MAEGQHFNPYFPGLKIQVRHLYSSSSMTHVAVYLPVAVYIPVALKALTSLASRSRFEAYSTHIYSSTCMCSCKYEDACSSVYIEYLRPLLTSLAQDLKIQLRL